MHTPGQALPRPGPRWGSYPQRPSGDLSGLGDTHWRTLPAWLPAAWLPTWHRRWLAQVRLRTEHWRNALPAQAPYDAHTSPRHDAIAQVSMALRRHGLTGESLVDGLALVSLLIEDTLGRRPHDTQLLATALLLDQRAAEMATGEGKTLAMAAAAAVAALSGMPVHVVTSNDYLAQRDAQDLAPLWAALGLRTGHISPDQQPDQRRAIYASDIVYATAKELAFDHLRDCLAMPGSGHDKPVMRGLCLALLDEADSILLDEAAVPLVISATRTESPAHQAQRRAIWWQAWQLTQALQPVLHFEHEAHGNGIKLTAEGEAQIAAHTAALQGVWRRPKLRHELAQLALSARHALHKDQHYLLRDKSIELLDTITGRVAVGRVWSQGLQALIEIKEGYPASPPTDTMAQLTFQRFFQRYWRMGALSGTLVEARSEIRNVYGLHTLRVPTRLPSRRQTLPPRLFATPQARWQAVAQCAASMQASGRPVLIGTDTVADSERLSWHLTQAGIAHTVLNARHDAEEAAIVAQAGQSGRITVATRMAGRGTDIHLDDRALAAGGLHIIDCQHNESPRMDRQLRGRCARQGQPGSTETWLCAGNSADRPTHPESKLRGWISSVSCAVLVRMPRWGVARLRLYQWMQAQRQMAMRRQLLEQDQQWETQHRLARRPG
jgi:preprotein translocase subunit SecA